MTTNRQRITVEEVAADPTNAYEVTVHGDAAIESLEIIDGEWVHVKYVNGGTSTGTPKHWANYVRIVETPEIPAHLQQFVLDMPALNGKPVLQGHADVCALIGHGYNLRDGIEQGYCPRCGTVTVPAEPVETLPSMFLLSIKWDGGWTMGALTFIDRIFAEKAAKETAQAWGSGALTNVTVTVVEYAPIPF